MADITTDDSGVQRIVNRRTALQSLGATGLALAAGCVGDLSGDEDWPSRQVEIVSPWAAGGGADRTSRAIADAAEDYTEEFWSVSNQTGGSGSIGMNAAATADPDGHTIGVAAPEIALFEHLDIDEMGPDDITPGPARPRRVPRVHVRPVRVLRRTHRGSGYRRVRIGVRTVA